LGWSLAQSSVRRSGYGISFFGSEDRDLARAEIALRKHAEHSGTGSDATGALEIPFASIPTAGSLSSSWRTSRILLAQCQPSRCRRTCLVRVGTWGSNLVITLLVCYEAHIASDLQGCGNDRSIDYLVHRSIAVGSFGDPRSDGIGASRPDIASPTCGERSPPSAWWWPKPPISENRGDDVRRSPKGSLGSFQDIRPPRRARPLPASARLLLCGA
jgi:hypothetical protein